MVRDKNKSALSFALLGLIGKAELSGYDLRKIFASTPMRSFSDSPGAIYPALQRLERKGFLRGRRDGAGGRKRVVFAVTARGRSEFGKWLAQPITRDDVIRRMDTLILKFAFLDQFGTTRTYPSPGGWPWKAGSGPTRSNCGGRSLLEPNIRAENGRSEGGMK